MKRLLYIPLDWKLKPNMPLFHAFEKYFITEHYTGDIEFAILFKPDYIYVQCGAFELVFLAALKKQTEAKVIQWTGNCNGSILDEVLIYKDIANITYLASGIGQKKEYEAVLNHPVRYWQHAVSDVHFRPVKTDLPDKKIRFIGNAYGQFDGAVERNELCRLLTNTFSEFEVWGNGFADGNYRNPDSIDYWKSFDLYNDSYIGISANCMNNIEGYWSNRPLDIMAAGACCLMRYTPNAEKWFTDMVHCVFYRDNDEAVKKIAFLLDNPDLRNRIAITGQQLVQKGHTFDYRAKQMHDDLNYLYHGIGNEENIF